jgi:transcription antitermination factor NusG
MQTGAAMNNRPVTYKIGQVVEFVDLIERERAEDQFQITPTSRWYVAVTNPNCQARAALGLHELGYRSFYPKIRRWVSHARVKTAKEKPLLGRYIFVEVDQPRQSFGAARAVNGIEGFVCNPDPVRIPNQFVQHMRERYVYGEWDFVRQEPCPFYEWNAVTGQMELQTRKNAPIPIGARIKIVEGEFNDMLAIVTARKGRRLDFKIAGENRYGRMNECSVRAA